MKAYRVKGNFRSGKNNQPFSKDIVAGDEESAKHQIFSNFGSRHRVSRRFVNIENIEEIDPSDSQAPVVRAYFNK